MVRSLALGLIVPMILGVATAVAQTPEELSATARFVAAFQNPDGGFAGSVGGASALGSTSSAIRTLKFVGGSIPDVPGAIRYVRSCRDAASGGFAPTPGGKPDPNTTSVALMALGDLRTGDQEAIDGGVEYLAKNAKSFEEVRLAVAGLEAVGKKHPILGEWTALVNKGRNADGTWGEGRSKAFATGSAGVALLRMGVELGESKSAVLAALRQGQNPDGGWSRDAEASDLGATYRIMRGFFMMKEKPDLGRLRGFIAKRAQSDGGFAPAPGKPADLSGTYQSSIILLWCRLLEGRPALVETAGFRPLFNGKDLDGWEGDTSLWKARDGMIVGQSPGIRQNQFLATKADYKDFVLQLCFRLKDGEGNSGVQFRSVRVPGTEMRGYQADIGQNYWGSLYDESRRNKVLVAASPRALEALRKDDWNHYVIRAMGDQITLTLNGVSSAQYREEDPEIARQGGKIALQVHAGGPMEIAFRDLYVQPLPSPVEDDSTTPGFHLKTASTAGGERKYTLYLPEGYDQTKTYPVVLFLHGAGERGTDGVKPAQVGLGPAILARPRTFPAIAVFPQARETWAAGSDDAKAALAVLDEVIARYRGDKSKVAITGLSMGGRGTWEIAAERADRFVAAAPICGPGKLADVAKLKALPIRAFVGDQEREPTLTNLRAMRSGLADERGDVKLTEYRNVGHNSWDRAYADPWLIDWMLGQKPR